jgi:murein DD-endopeptidase MepM/ murein hydrolase activator NlpD
MKPTKVACIALAAPLLTLAGMIAIPVLAASGSGAPPPTPTAGIPERALHAYRAAGAWCEGLRWELLAGIGWVESRHGTTRGARINPHSGEVSPWILGPPLDGSPGVLRLPAGRWLGWWGLPGPWQQAVGPMQFLPATFEAWAVDADADGVAKPHDIDDAVASAANYLCGGPDGEIHSEQEALLRYNRSHTYVREVLAYADSLATPATGAGILCPVAGPTSFTDTWLAPRSGGRRHQGVDMFAAHGTPVVAPVAGVAERSNNTLGGLGFRLWGDDGNFYYGAHLAAFGPHWGRVQAGTLLGYVGNTGNARGTPPHLHFEIHPGRTPGEPAGAVNPTPAVTAACKGSQGPHAFLSDD